MLMTLASSLVPVLRLLDPETAHAIALRAIRAGLAGTAPAPDDPALAVTAFGLDFPNPIGLAAGFDKNATAARGLMRLGFGFIESGTVTPRPQSGNPRPRLFRLRDDLAVINRMGFNGAGSVAFQTEIARLTDRPIPLGVNLGINKEGADPPTDYRDLARMMAPLCDYLVINVSSPNTPGLRDLQSEARLAEILASVMAEPDLPPVLVKLAPDLGDAGLAGVIETCVAHGVRGVIVGNTTITRPPGLRSLSAAEPGGLSGRPLFALSTRVLAKAFLLAAGRLTLIGAGGVFNGADVLTKIRAGASLVQLYTGFAWHGPALIPRLKAELLTATHAAGFARVADAVGSQARDLADG